VIVVFAAAAKADLLEIGDWIARDSPRRAASFVDELWEDCIALRENPGRYQVVSRYREFGIRRRVHGAYLIFYRVDGDRVSILRIVHGARDFDPLIFPEQGP
jgi:toxin ParE1/3/4